MKKIFLLLVFLGLFSAITGCILGVCGTPSFKRQINGSGKITTKTIAAPQFNRISASRGVKVILSEELTSEISIAADDNIMKYVQVTSSGDQLKVTLDSEMQNIGNHNVTVRIPADRRIYELKASSAAKIEAQKLLSDKKISIDVSSAAQITSHIETTQCAIEASSAAAVFAQIKATQCAIKASSAAKIEADLNVSECSIDLSSAAKAQVRGAAANCAIETSSASHFTGSEFLVDYGVVKSSSSSKVQIKCAKQLNAKASSGSSIIFEGDCNATISESSGGNIRKK